MECWFFIPPLVQNCFCKLSDCLWLQNSSLDCFQQRQAHFSFQSGDCIRYWKYNTASFECELWISKPEVVKCTKEFTLLSRNNLLSPVAGLTLGKIRWWGRDDKRKKTFGFDFMLLNLQSEKNEMYGDWSPWRPLDVLFPLWQGSG